MQLVTVTPQACGKKLSPAAIMGQHLMGELVAYQWQSINDPDVGVLND